VYGQPIVSGETLVVPIASVSQAFGMGGGIGHNEPAEDKRNEGVGGGGGGLVRARPIAVAEIDAEGVKVHAVVDENRALAVSLAFAAWAVFWTARTLIKIFKPATN
ncbi:MAG TPA: spore germination protein GerW family protein, partial [Anaerolineae bacterium]|nr:spore germination protein GerW family protein [Anaerolineae bacterium]